MRTDRFTIGLQRRVGWREWVCRGRTLSSAGVDGSQLAVLMRDWVDPGSDGRGGAQMYLDDRNAS